MTGAATTTQDVPEARAETLAVKNLLVCWQDRGSCNILVATTCIDTVRSQRFVMANWTKLSVLHTNKNNNKIWAQSTSTE